MDALVGSLLRTLAAERAEADQRLQLACDGFNDQVMSVLGALPACLPDGSAAAFAGDLGTFVWRHVNALHVEVQRLERENEEVEAVLASTQQDVRGQVARRLVLEAELADIRKALAGEQAHVCSLERLLVEASAPTRRPPSSAGASGGDSVMPSPPSLPESSSAESEGAGHG